MDLCQELLHSAVELDLQERGVELLLVMEGAVLITCLSLVHQPPLILPSAILGCTLLPLLALHSPLEAQGPPSICPPFSLLLLCPHRKVFLIPSKHRASTTQHHPSQKLRPTCWELNDAKMRKRTMTISLSTTYYMPKAQLHIHPSTINLHNNYRNHTHRFGMGTAKECPMK